MPVKEIGYSWTTITTEMKNDIVYKTLRTETKKRRGFYTRMELIKQKQNKAVAAPKEKK
jgi:hypothetical protein